MIEYKCKIMYKSLIENKNNNEILNTTLRISDISDEVCPECGEPIIEKWSGVKCSECDWWFCY